MILPLSHERMTVQRLPWITMGIAALNCIVFLFSWPLARRDQENLRTLTKEIEELAYTQWMNQDERGGAEVRSKYEEIRARLDEALRGSFFGRYGFVPARRKWASPFSSMFLHAGWVHLIGNLYLLWLCGCSIEDLWGRPVYAAFYGLGGAAAAVSHALAFPESEVPLVGASGAIAALMGAFLVRLCQTRIRFFYWYYIRCGTFYAPAGIMLPLWLLSQLFYAFVYGDRSPVAFWAHVGGFLFGAAAALFIKLTRVEEKLLAPAIEEKTTLFRQHPSVQAALTAMDRGGHQEAVRHLLVALQANPDDVDALQLLAQCQHALGRPDDAATAYRRKIRAHLKRNDKHLAVDGYIEMMSAVPGVRLTPRESLAVASALADSGRFQDAVAGYRRVLDESSEPILKLKASVALADLYLQDHQRQHALEVLHAATVWTQSHPEWKAHLDERIEALNQPRTRPRAGRPDF